MTLDHINIDDLIVSPLNVRKFGAKDCDDLVASIRALGVLQPLLVRPVSDGFEVVAGQRRLNACRIIAEDGDIDPIPCLVMAEGDDATAIEASLAENLERLPMDEVDQYKAFAKLIKEGRSADDIASNFGITESMVSQRLALGRLYAPILTAYRKGDIHAGDIRNLTMATPRQQKAWWALVKDDEVYAPTGQRLKSWLFGGAHIPTESALFDVEASGLAVVSDLFGDHSYFADCETFWAQQNAAIAAKIEALQEDGWAQVTLLETGAYFATWEHATCGKEDDGQVFVEVSHKGEVTFHEGYITNAAAKRREKTQSGDAPAAKPELTKAAQNYVDLHRHAAVRADLLDHSDIALRLIAAHMIAESSLWEVQGDPQKAAKSEIADSLESNKGQIKLAEERAAIVALLGLDAEATPMAQRGDYAPRPCITEVFAQLQTLSDEDVTRILTFLMAESLSVHSSLIDTLGTTMSTDMAQHWQTEPFFLELIHDKQTLNAMIAECAGSTVAKANLTETAKTQRSILGDCLNGTRTPVDANWMPRYMAFPQGSYAEETKQADIACGEEQGATEKDAA